MIRSLEFYKEPAGTWYVNLPEWEGAKAELMMVSGADTMLDIASNNGDKIKLTVNNADFEGATELILRREGDQEGGGHYFVNKYKGQQLGLEIWLCEITRFVFGYLPERIFFKVTE